MSHTSRALSVAPWFGLGLAVVGTMLQVEVLAAQTGSTPRAADHEGLLRQYCVGCHNDRTLAGSLSLQERDLVNLSADAEIWEKVVRKLDGGFMPPPGRPRPDRFIRDAFVTALETELDAAAATNPNPGRSAVLHRLNRTEYQNAIRDLLAVDMDIVNLLPPDGQNFGFDNNGDALGFSPLLLDRYLSVSRHVSRMAVGDPMTAPVATSYHVETDFGQDDRIEGLPYGTRGGMVVRHPFPLDGEYEIDIKLARNYNFQVVDLYEPHEMEVLLDGERVQLLTITPPPGERRLGGPEGDDALRFRIPAKAGPREFAVTFIRRPSAQSTDERLPFIRGDPKENELHGLPWLGEFTITGPHDASGTADTPSRRRIFTCTPTHPDEEPECASSILSALARRAYRRPVTAADLRPLLDAYEDERKAGGNFEAGIELALQRILLSSSFLFRIELDPEDATPGEVYQVDDFALASRLSFFLWNSIPDEQLLDEAAHGRLRDLDVLTEQVRRMLADPRAGTLATNFAGQWLELRKLDESIPYQRTFPNFDDNLRQAFRRETELLVETVLRQDRPLSELLTADYTFVNERLARHYRMDGVYGDRFRRVSVDSPRQGLLGHGSVLTVTSYPNRTSPVLRGVWILTNLLGTPPPEPPPDVPDLPERSSGGKVLSMRDRMAQHRDSPVCSACHTLMDPLGLSLENFDAVGAGRARSASGEPIDASGSLPGVADFEGVDGLRSVLVNRLDAFYTNVTERMLTYALGRGVGAGDMPAVRGILREAAKTNYQAQSLILAIVRSLPFQMKRAVSYEPLTAVGAP
ncbi:MAG: DUF1592 domain-containing protein [Acidobacteriota bacterium]|nr:DUF1592 domain-containing protein [Acidobacteriota bacterium]